MLVIIYKSLSITLSFHHHFLVWCQTDITIYYYCLLTQNPTIFIYCHYLLLHLFTCTIHHHILPPLFVSTICFHICPLLSSTTNLQTHLFICTIHLVIYHHFPSIITIFNRHSPLVSSTSTINTYHFRPSLSLLSTTSCLHYYIHHYHA